MSSRQGSKDSSRGFTTKWKQMAQSNPTQRNLK